MNKIGPGERRMALFPMEKAQLFPLSTKIDRKVCTVQESQSRRYREAERMTRQGAITVVVSPWTQAGSQRGGRRAVSFSRGVVADAPYTSPPAELLYRMFMAAAMARSSLAMSEKAGREDGSDAQHLSIRDLHVGSHQLGISGRSSPLIIPPGRKRSDQELAPRRPTPIRQM